jgi:SAM-dependent methyltransferase
LDLGCGFGRNYTELGERGLREGFVVYGMDIAHDVIYKAKTRVKKESQKLLAARISQGDAHSLRFKDEFFDAVYANDIPAKDVSDWKDVFRVVKLCGVLYVRLLYDVHYHRDEDRHDDWGFSEDVAKSMLLTPEFNTEFYSGVHQNEGQKRPHDTKYIVAKMRKR